MVVISALDVALQVTALFVVTPVEMMDTTTEKTEEMSTEGNEPSIIAVIRTCCYI